MLTKTIKYKDVNDNDVEGTFYFNLSKAEMAEMAIGKEGKAGGFDVWIRTLIESQDGEVLVKTFKDILLKTVGQPSEDGKRFVKSDEITKNFLDSDAYSELFMELMMDPDRMSAFVNGIVPASMRGEVAKKIAEAPDLANFRGPEARVEEKSINATPEPKDDRPDWLKEGRVPTETELKGATPAQIQEAFRLRAQNAGPVTQEEITGS